LKFHKCGISH